MTTASNKLDRFRLLRIFVLVFGLVLGLRVIQVQVFQHEKYKKIADSQWVEEIPLLANRGNIYDRSGRPLAVSVSRWRVGVARSLVKDPDGLARLLAPILELKEKSLRKKLSRGQGHLVLGRNVVLSRKQKIALENQRAVTLQDLNSRIYPYGSVGASLIGFHTHGKENSVSTGMELGLDKYLAGTEGRGRRIKRAGSSEDLGQVVLEQPRHGLNVVLSLDADLQSLCERRLVESVRKLRAKGGSVLITDPHTGDILAAASYPVLESRQGDYSDPALWNNRNFTHCFEPGSVFKIFSTASFLRNAAIDTATVYDCSNGDFGSFTIRNDANHKYGNLPLMRAFSKSSNIYFARAAGNLSNEEFYRDLVDFGFGQKTTLPYPGQASGILHTPSTWSVRSRPTIAIGQEIAVTPLQLAMALGAVANGGQLMAPRLTREIRGAEGRRISEPKPVPLRRIMSEPLADLLRQAMARVVKEGTAKSISADWITTGGKTGTAQIARGAQGFVAGAYMASFGAIVPVEDPRFVILTVLEEPQGYNMYYASESAVPLFENIVRDIRQSTNWLDDVPGGRTAPLAMPEGLAENEVPDVLLLSVDKAVRRLAQAGFRVAGIESGGDVVQQVPAAGSLVPTGQTVHLTVATRQRTENEAVAVCPDFTGMSNRQARGLAARLGVALDIQGVGYAISQNPTPGSALTRKQVSVRMEGAWR